MDLIRKRPRIEAQKIIVIFFGVCTGFALWLAFDFPEEEKLRKTENFELDFSPIAEYSFEKSKKILFFTPRFGKKDWNFGIGNAPFENQMCRVQNCFLTADQNLLNDISKFDALLFHISGINQDVVKHLPESRNPNQRWIFSAAAPPKNNQFSYHDKIK